MDIVELLTFAVENKASDLHLSAGALPMMRADGDLQKINRAVLGHDELLAMIQNLMDEPQRKELIECWETDLAFEISGLARFRGNVFNQRRGIGVVFRIIPFAIPSLVDLHLPAMLNEITCISNGLVLVTGPTGSGKSTTLAAMVDCINSSRQGHILTVEDPIEFVHHSKHCLVNQREVHQDTHSFNHALRAALREDPDVILMGELRDLEAIRLAMTAAETGHLVLATLHTNSAVHTINRLIDVFPSNEKAMVRSILSESLQAVIAQTLVKRHNGGRVAALEIMRCTAAIRNLIREDKVAQMFSFIQTGKKAGMQTRDQHLMELVHTNIISQACAHHAAADKSLFTVA